MPAIREKVTVALLSFAALLTCVIVAVLAPSWSGLITEKYYIRRLASDHDEQKVADAAKKLASMNSIRAAPMLVSVLRRYPQRSATRVCIWDALFEIAESRKIELMPLWMKLLDSESVGEKTLGVIGVSNIGPGALKALPTLVNIVREFQVSNDHTVSREPPEEFLFRATIIALGVIGKAPDCCEVLEEALVKLPSSKDLILKTMDRIGCNARE